MRKRWVGSALSIAAAASIWGCVIDPGENFEVPLSVFNENFFYCHVEPEYLFAAATQCGAGQSGDNGNCHFNPSAVSGMTLQDHPLINCAGGDVPVANDPTGAGATGPGTPAANNFSSASLEMSRECQDYATCQAAILKRPTSTTDHPRQIFDPTTDTTLQNVIYKWAATP